MFTVPTTAAPATPVPGAPAVAATVAPVVVVDKNSKEYRDTMAAKGRASAALRPASETTVDETTDAPEGDAVGETTGATPILGKFKTQAELEKAYTELEKKLSTGKPVEPVTPPTDEEAAALAAAAAALPSEVPDFVALGEEFRSNNMDLTPASKDKLVAVYGKEIVESHLAGLKAQVELNTYQVCEAADVSVKEAKSMVAWAATGLTKGEQLMFNRSNAGSTEEAVESLKWLKGKFTEVNGEAPSRVLEGGSPATGVAGFSSKSQITEAIRDPRYKKDAAYRDDVARRLQATSAENRTR